MGDGEHELRVERVGIGGLARRITVTLPGEAPQRVRPGRHVSRRVAQGEHTVSAVSRLARVGWTDEVTADTRLEVAYTSVPEFFRTGRGISLRPAPFGSGLYSVPQDEGRVASGRSSRRPMLLAWVVTFVALVGAAWRMFSSGTDALVVVLVAASGLVAIVFLMLYLRRHWRDGMAPAEEP